MANVNNYIAAGKSAVRKNLQARKALADNKADYGALGQEAIKAERDKKIAVIQANAKVANAAQNAMTKVEGAEISADEKRSITKSENNARKAGMLAGGAAILGYAAMQGNKEDENTELRDLMKAQTDYYRNKAANANTRGSTNLERPELPTFETPDEVTPTVSDNSTGGGNSDTTKPTSSTPGKIMSQSDIYAKIVAKGRSPEFAKQFSAIAMAESGGKVDNDTVKSGLDPNKKNEYSIGLFQVNTQAHMDKLNRRNWTADDLRDPDKALDIALEIHDEAGSFKPWGAYTNGSYTKWLK
jgi:hypothetical protein